MFIKLSTAIFFSLILVGQAQAYQITVKEKGDPIAIEGAVVVINESDVYAETDEKGLAEFPDDQPLQHVKILAAGYQTLIINKPELNSEYQFYLVPQEIDGQSIEVVADRVLEKGSKISLSSQEVNGSAGSQGDPIKAITSLPGTVQASDGSGQVYMRGSGLNENIVWVDRAPVGYLYHLGGIQSTIHPGLVEDINIFQGGFPVEYGNALGGAIDVSLRTPKKDRVHFQADISTLMSSFLLEGPVYEGSKDSFAIGGRRSYLDAVFDPDTFNSDDEDETKITLLPTFYDTQILYHQHLNKGAVDYFMFTAGDELGIDIRGSDSDPQLNGALKSKREFQTIGATWTQNWNKKLSHIINLSYVHNKSAFNIGRDDNGDPYYVKSESHQLFFQPELRYSPSLEQQFFAGIEVSAFQAPIDLSISRRPRESDPGYDLTTQEKFQLEQTIKGRKIAPYIKYRQQWTQKLTSIAGLLYDDVTYNGGFHDGSLSPRLALEYMATQDTLLTASWGRYFQAPGGLDVIDGFGNPALVMTEAEHRVIGIQHQFTKNYSVSLEAYHKPMDNLVVTVDDNLPPENYQNEGEGEAYGFDLFLKRRAEGRKIGWFSLSWGRSKRTNLLTGEERDFSGDQPLTATFVWGQPFPGTWNSWDWGIKARANTGQPYTNITGRQREDESDSESRWLPEYGPNNGSRLPNYYKVDFRIGKQVLFNESKLKFYLDLQNILFTENVSGYDFGDEYEKYDNPTKETDLGFFPYFGIEMIF